MRVAVIGGNGQLGVDVCAAHAAAGNSVIPMTHGDVDIRDRDAVFRALESLRPDVVVNTAAMHNLEACEKEPDMAAAVNATGAINLAEAGRDLGFSLMHVSTDYVFDGRKGAAYVETDTPAPLSVYGKTKLEGEDGIRRTLPAHMIVRTSGLYGRAACRAKPGGNFVQLMLRLARERGEVRVVTDEVVTPTYTEALAQQMVRLQGAGRFGVYHATSQGETSWYDFAKAVFEISGVTVRMIEAGVADFPQKAPRPKYSVLDNAALRSAGLDIMPHWRDALTAYLRAA
jgi:dTDP-4-dehydrorhamnose reductase